MKEFLVNETDHFLYLKLNRPEKRNCLTESLMNDLTLYLEEKKNNLNSLKAVVLTGEGKSFCAGADLNWMKSMVNFSFEENKEDSLKLFNLFNAFYTFPLPVISFAHGHVFGGGLGFLGASDYVISSPETQFCFSEVKLGLIPAVISSFLLSKCSVAHTHAFMGSGEVFSEQEALQMGLVQKIKPNTEGLLKNYEASDQSALIECKKLTQAQRAFQPATFKTQTVEAISKLRTSEAAQKRMNAFLEKKTNEKKTSEKRT